MRSGDPNYSFPLPIIFNFLVWRLFLGRLDSSFCPLEIIRLKIRRFILPLLEEVLRQLRVCIKSIFETNPCGPVFDTAASTTGDFCYQY